MSQEMTFEQSALSFILNLWISDEQVSHWISLKSKYREHLEMEVMELSRLGSKFIPTGSRFEAMSCYGYWDRIKGKPSRLSYPDADVMLVMETILIKEEGDDCLFSSHIIEAGKYLKLNDPVINYSRFLEALALPVPRTRPMSIARSKLKNKVTFSLCSNDTTHPGFTCIKEGYVSLKDKSWPGELTLLKNKDVHSATLLGEGQIPLDFESHGPALTREERPYGALPFDIVTAISYHFWPKAAFKWIGRARKSGWPDVKLRFQILNTGCLFVPVGSHTGVNPEVEWRYSFSVAEEILANHINLIQRKAYLLFKTLCKFSVCKANNHSDTCNNLASYHLKTVFFWCLEDISKSEWCQEKLLFCICHLLDKLLSFLWKIFIPNFFIPENNMIDHFSDMELNNIRSFAESIRNNLLELIITVDEKVGIAGASIPKIPITVICEPVIKFLTSLRSTKLSMSLIKIDFLETKLKSLSRMGLWWFICCNQIGINYKELFTEKVFDEFVLSTETMIITSNDNERLSHILSVIKQRHAAEILQNSLALSNSAEFNKLISCQKLLDEMEIVYVRLLDRIMHKLLNDSCLWKLKVLIYGGSVTLNDAKQIIKAYQVLLGIKER